jgi:uncharacterized SAM-binding protein YcdF (DUF218 family)
MFFFFSKILAILFMPLSWVIILLALAFILKKRKRTRKRLLIAAFATLLFFTNSFILMEFMRGWEVDAINKDKLQSHYDVGIVLGGGMVDYDFANDRAIFRGNTDRIMQAVSLYKENRIDYILISGGAGSLIQRDIVEAKILYEYLRDDIGIPDSALIVDSLSDNTHQNAINCKELLHDIDGEDYLLITSASHMRRANLCFEKQGIYTDNFAVDHNAGPRRWDVFILLFPNTEALELWNEMIHEWVGMLVYKIKGYV